MKTSNASSYIGFSRSLNFHINNKYALRATGTLYFRDAVNLPNDFNTDAFFRINLESILSVGVSAGRVFLFNSEGKSRFTLWLGLAYTNYETLTDFRKIDEVYDYDLQNNREIGVVFRPTFEFPLLHYFGVSIYPLIRIQKQNTYFGLGAGYMIGKLRNRK